MDRREFLQFLLTLPIVALPPLTGSHPDDWQLRILVAWHRENGGRRRLFSAAQLAKRKELQHLGLLPPDRKLRSQYPKRSFISNEILRMLA